MQCMRLLQWCVDDRLGLGRQLPPIARHLVGVRPHPELPARSIDDQHPTVVRTGMPGPALRTPLLADLHSRSVRVTGPARPYVDLVQIQGEELMVLSSGRLLEQLLAVRYPMEASTTFGIISHPDRRHLVTVLPLTGPRLGSRRSSPECPLRRTPGRCTAAPAPPGRTETGPNLWSTPHVSVGAEPCVHRVHPGKTKAPSLWEGGPRCLTGRDRRSSVPDVQSGVKWRVSRGHCYTPVDTR